MAKCRTCGRRKPYRREMCRTCWAIDKGYPPCRVDGCERISRQAGYCGMHYQRVWAKGAPGSTGPQRDDDPQAHSLDNSISVAGNPGESQVRRWGTTSCSLCDEPHLARGLCATHYRLESDRLAYDAEKSRRRRARVVGSALVYPIPTEAIQARIDYFGGCCHLCGEPNADTIDHVKPLAVGGAHLPANLRPAHRSCNSSKGATWKGVV